MIKDQELSSLTQIPRVKRVKSGMSASYHSGNEMPDDAAIDLACWRPYANSADRDVLPAKDMLEGRSVDVYQNDGYIAGSVQHHVDTVIGSGIKLNLRPDWKALGQTEEWAEEYSKSMESSWGSWTNPARQNVDVRGIHNWPAVQAAAWRSQVIHGEILASFETRRSKRGSYNTKIRLIDPTRLSDPKKGPHARKQNIRGGIEYDSDGAAIAYHISSRHPRDYRGPNQRTDIITWTRYPAYNRNGKRMIFHSFDPMRVEQSRGVTMLAPILRAIKMIDKVSNATLQAALLQTIFAAVVKSNADHDKIMEVIGSSTKETDGVKAMQQYMNMRADFYAQNRINVKGAKAIHLLPDEDLELTTAKAANPEVGQFLDNFRQEIARGQGMTLESFTGNYEKTSYSSSRMSASTTGKGHEGRATRVLVPFCSWVFDLWAEEHFIRNPEILPQRASFWEFQDALTRADWKIPPPIDPDPEKTAKAAVKRMEAGVSTLQYECSLLGMEWEATLEQQAKEANKKKSLGLFELEAEQVTADNGGPDPEPVRPPAGGSQ